jgi:hypothetical protein
VNGGAAESLSSLSIQLELVQLLSYFVLITTFVEP